MTEQEHAEQLARILDLRLKHPRAAGPRAVTPQPEAAERAPEKMALAHEDQALLKLAEQLFDQAPFAPTPYEQAKLRRSFEQQKGAWVKNSLPGFLRSALQGAGWAALLLGVFAVIGLLLANLLGKPANPTAGPALTTPPQPVASATPQPVTLTLDQALVLINHPTWGSVFFEYQLTWQGPDGKIYSFYKQAWMDSEKRGRVISSDQVEGDGPRPADLKPTLLFISDGQRLKALALPSGKEIEGFANATWRANPLENAGQGMSDFFPALSGIDQAGDLTLEPLAEIVAGRQAFVLRAKSITFWYDLETGLLLRKAQRGELQSQWLVKSVVYNAALPEAFASDEGTGLAQIHFAENLPPVLPDSAPAQSTFLTQSQTVNGTRMELREVTSLGSSLRATLCYPQPDQHTHRLMGVELKVGEQVLPFFPTNSEMPGPDADGLTCETFTGANPGVSPLGAWALTARRLIAPRDSTPDCDLVNRQLALEFSGLTLVCDQPGSGSFGFSAGETPDGMDQYEAERMRQTFIEYDVSSGPWVFTFNAADILPQIAASSAPDLVIVPGACNPDMSQLTKNRAGLPVSYQSNPVGTAGSGSIQSGLFDVKMGLICDPNMNRLISGGDYHSEINGLGIYWNVTYQGEAVTGNATHYSGVSPFVIETGGTGEMSQGSSMDAYHSLSFPEGIRPDFTQSDVRLRYLVKIRAGDGALEGAALSFTLQRAPDGYRPVDVTVEPLSEAERQTAESAPNDPIPFPTLRVPVAVLPADTQTVMALLDQWQKPLLGAPGWLHLRTRTEMPRGTDLFAGLTEYINDDWFQIDAQANVIAMIHIDSRLDGTVLQQTIAQNGKTANLSFGNTEDFKPYPLDLGYAVKDTLKAGDQAKITYRVSLDGKPVMQVTLNGMVTRRDVVDASTGAWLYTETVQVKSGDDPATGGTLDNRLTLEIAERVDAPPANALALLGQTFTGFTPIAPYGTPAPQGFDPAYSKLTLHTTPGDDFNTPSFWYGDIYAANGSTADGYLIGRVDFGNVPGGSCARSAGGARLAFNYTALDQKGNFVGNSLRWFDLHAIETIHQPAPELVNIGTLSWSPKEETLAVFGCKANQQGCGLYLLDPVTDQVRLLIPDVYAGWPPIWSPEGLLAFVDNLNQKNTLYVVDIHTGQVSYQGQFDADAWQAPADSPTNAWGVTFPRDGYANYCFTKQ